MIQIGKEELLSKVVVSDSPCVVHFHNPEPEHSSDLDIALSDLARSYRGRVSFLQVDLADEMRECLSQKFGPDGFPALVLFAGGNEWKRFTGEISEEEIKKELDFLLIAGAEG